MNDEGPIVSLMISSPGIISMRELSVLLPRGPEYVQSTIMMEAIDPDGIDTYWEGLDYVARQIRTAHPELVVQITVAASLGGAGRGPHELKSRISESTGVPVVVSLLACVEALQSLSSARPLVVAPYPEPTLVRLGDTLANEGLSPTVSYDGPKHIRGDRVHQSPVDEVRSTLDHMIGSSFKQGEHDAVLIAGGGWPTISLINTLEERYSVPVISSNKALAMAVSDWLEKRNLSDGI